MASPKGRTLKHGDTVLTPAGEIGRVLRRSTYIIAPFPEYVAYDLDGEADVLAYSVLLESGEVRQYSFEALSAANRSTD